MGVLSCFFPIVVSAAGGMREIDKVLIRVGRSFRLTTAQMVTKIYLPAMREPHRERAAAGFGRRHHRHAARGNEAVEPRSRLSHHSGVRGVRHAADVRPAAVLFVVSIGVNALIGRLATPGRAFVAPLLAATDHGPARTRHAFAACRNIATSTTAARGMRRAAAICRRSIRRRAATSVTCPMATPRTSTRRSARPRTWLRAVACDAAPGACAHPAANRGDACARTPRSSR